MLRAFTRGATTGDRALRLLADTALVMDPGWVMVVIAAGTGAGTCGIVPPGGITVVRVDGGDVCLELPAPDVKLMLRRSGMVVMLDGLRVGEAAEDEAVAVLVLAAARAAKAFA